MPYTSCGLREASLDQTISKVRMNDAALGRAKFQNDAALEHPHFKVLAALSEQIQG